MVEEKEQYVVSEIIDGRPYVMSQHTDYTVAREGRGRVWEGRLAVVTKAEADAVVASGKPLEIEMLDLKDGRKPYRATYPTNADWYFQAVELLQVSRNQTDLSAFTHTFNDYLISSHFCPCHRERDIVGEQPVATPDDEQGGHCKHGRWLINSATHPAIPGVTLYREWDDQQT